MWPRPMYFGFNEPAVHVETKKNEVCRQINYSNDNIKPTNILCRMCTGDS